MKNLISVNREVLEIGTVNNVFNAVLSADVFIGGRWQGFFGFRNKKYPEFIKAHQVGFLVWGDIRSEKNGDKNTRMFIFFGLYRNGVLSAAYRGVDSRLSERGNFRLRLINDQQLKGKCIFTGQKNGIIESKDYSWYRIID